MNKSYLLITTLLLALTGCNDETTVNQPQEEAASASRPSLLSAQSMDNKTVIVSYDSEMSESAADVSRYRITMGDGSGQLHIAAAEFSDDRQTDVLLTTLSQSEVMYTLRVTSVQDSAGAAMNGSGSEVQFSGTSPSGSQFTDTDADGLTDDEEQLGWAVTVLLANGQGAQSMVTSDPQNPDTDGDGLSDLEEKFRRTDPRNTDSDDDTLSDQQEIEELFSSAINQDSDGDGLTDGDEFYRFRTSPSHVDTDGDQLLDSEEVLLANRNPRNADVPLPAIEVGDVDLRLDVRFTASSSQGSRELETKSVESTLAQRQSRTHSNNSSMTHEVMAKATVSGEYSAKVGAEGAGYKIGGSVEAGYTGQWTSGFTQESSNESQRTVANTYSTDAEVTQQETVQRDVAGASMSVPVYVKSVGNIAFTIRNLQITAFVQNPRDAARLIPVATLVLDPSLGLPNEFNLGPLVPRRGPFIFTNDQIFPSIIEDLMIDPRGLIFKVANFDITDEVGRNFAFTSQEINERTTPFIIDFGGVDTDGDGEGDQSERYNLATSGGRPVYDTNGDNTIDRNDRRVIFDADGGTVGITVAEALEEIIGLRHYDEDDTPTESLSDDEIQHSYSTREVEGVNVIWRVRRISKQLGNPLRQWEILNAGGIAERSLEFRDEVLSPENGMIVANVQDLDDDRIPARWEYIHGCSDDQTDTDGDGLDDRFELFEGWTVDVVGRGTTRSYSSCARTDSDLDGLTDAEEANRTVDIDTDGDGTADLIAVPAPTDARRFDSDEDGISDFDELNGYVVDLRFVVDPQTSCQDYPDSQVGVDSIICTSNPLNADSDGDTLDDGDELNLGTDPTVDDGEKVFDDDGDGLSNFDEMLGASVSFERASTLAGAPGIVVTCTSGDDGIPECDGSNEPTSDPFVADTDGDGLDDGEERNLGLHPRNSDTDGDGLSDSQELADVVTVCGNVERTNSLNPNDADVDNDTLSDGAEVGALSEDGSWIVNVVGSSNYHACPDPEAADSDLDTLSDGEEFVAGTDPNQSDTDDDTIDDAIELAPGRGTNPLQADQRVRVAYTAIDVVGNCDPNHWSVANFSHGYFVGMLRLQKLPGGSLINVYNMENIERDVPGCHEGLFGVRYCNTVLDGDVATLTNRQATFTLVEGDRVEASNSQSCEQDDLGHSGCRFNVTAFLDDDVLSSISSLQGSTIEYEPNEIAQNSSTVFSLTSNNTAFDEGNCQLDITMRKDIIRN